MALDRTARPKPPGRSLEPASNRGPRGMIVSPTPDAPQGAQAKADRIRLIGRLRHFQLSTPDPSPRQTPRTARVAGWQLTYNSRMHSRAAVLVLAIVAAAALGVAQAPQGPQSEGALRPAARRRPRAGVPAAQHPRLQAAIDAGRAAASGAAREVSRSSTSTAISRRRSPPTSSIAGRVDGSAEPASAGQRQRRVGRSAGRRRSQALRHSQHKDRMVQFTNIKFHNVGPGFGQRAAAAARGGRQGRRARPRRDQQGLRPDRAQEPTARG